MPFGKVSNSVATFQPANFDDGRHELELVGLEDSEHPTFGAGLKWVWRFKTMDGTQIVDDRNMPFESWQFTGTGLGIDRKTGGPTKARKNVEALLRRKLEEGEDPPDPEELVGRKALGMVILNEQERLEITKIEPLKAKAKAPIVGADEEDDS